MDTISTWLAIALSRGGGSMSVNVGGRGSEEGEGYHLAGNEEVEGSMAEVAGV